MDRDTISIQQPCDADWSEMSGDERRRFCALCNKHVHNLSAMPRAEAQRVIAAPNVCVRYQPNADGSVQYQSRRRFVVAALSMAVALPAAASVAPKSTHRSGLLSRLMSWLEGSDPMVGEPKSAVSGTEDTGQSVEEAPPPPIMGEMMEPPIQMGRVSSRDEHSE